MKFQIIKCPNCENELQIAPTQIGRQMKCRHCGEAFWAKKSLIVVKANKGACFFIGFIFSLFGVLIAAVCYGKEGTKWALAGILGEIIAGLVIAFLFTIVNAIL